MSRQRVHAIVLAAYATAALVFFWPLPAHLSTHLTGPPTGDTGTYVWNQWVFRHEVVDERRLPFSTSTIFSLTPRVDLALHNYTTFPDLLALPLIPILGIVATFNVVYLAMLVLSAYAMFLLARALTGRDAESWLAGLLFGFSPFLVTRSLAHFSLLAAAPLPIFMLLLMRAVRTERPAHAAAAGAVVAWAAFCDVYYAVYGVMLAACYLVARIVQVELDPTRPRRTSRRLLDAAIAVVAGLVAGIVIRGGIRFELLGLSISARSLYTPVLILTALVALRLLLMLRLRVEPRALAIRACDVRALACGILAMVVLLSPVLYAVTRRFAEGRYVQPRVYWRSSPPGVDALAFVLPNPNHPLAGPLVRAWLPLNPSSGYIGSVASVGLVALIVIGVAMARGRFRPPRFWLFITVFFASLALGPFVRIGGLNTLVPTPWALLRYVPLIGSARSPGRFDAVVMMGTAVLFAMALAELRRRSTRPVRLLVLVGAALVFELAPMPRPLFSAEIPAIYDRIARDPRRVRVLELPVGVRDGTSSTGDFNAAAQYYQTRHGKRLVGGYLSRVSPRRVREHRGLPIVDALLTLSEGKPLSVEQSQWLGSHGRIFVTRARIGYVVIDTTRATEDLRSLAVTALGLKKIDEAAGRELYVPDEQALKAGDAPPQTD